MAGSANETGRELQPNGTSMEAHHRHGVGAAMLRLAERDLAEKGIWFLEVETLADTHPAPGYGETRAFYRVCGFEDLEIFPTLWDAGNPVLQVIKTIPS